MIQELLKPENKGLIVRICELVSSIYDWDTTGLVNNNKKNWRFKDCKTLNESYPIALIDLYG